MLCVSDSSENIFVKKFRLSRGAERIVKEREKTGHTSGRIQQGGTWSKSECSVVRATRKSFRVFEADMELGRKDIDWTCSRTCL